MTLAFHLNKPDLHQPSRASRRNRAPHRAGSYASLRVPWRRSVINSPHPRHPQSRGLIKASLSWWPHLPKQPWKLSTHCFAQDQCPLATALPSSMESLQHRDILLMPQADVWRPGSSPVLQKAQRLSVLVIKVKNANFIQVALLIVFYCKTHA